MFALCNWYAGRGAGRLWTRGAPAAAAGRGPFRVVEACGQVAGSWPGTPSPTPPHRGSRKNWWVLCVFIYIIYFSQTQKFRKSSVCLAGIGAKNVNIIRGVFIEVGVLEKTEKYGIRVSEPNGAAGVHLVFAKFIGFLLS